MDLEILGNIVTLRNWALYLTVYFSVVFLLFCVICAKDVAVAFVSIAKHLLEPPADLYQFKKLSDIPLKHRDNYKIRKHLKKRYKDYLTE